MPATSHQILMVGNPSAQTAEMLFRLARRGCVARHVDTLAEARRVMETSRFDVALAPENLRDGRGYDLAAKVARQMGSLYVGIPLSETLWLPVVERGALVLGQRALNANIFENEVELALGLLGDEARDAENKGSEALEGTAQRVSSVRRGGAAAA